MAGGKGEMGEALGRGKKDHSVQKSNVLANQKNQKVPQGGAAAEEGWKNFCARYAKSFRIAS